MKTQCDRCGRASNDLMVMAVFKPKDVITTENVWDIPFKEEHWCWACRTTTIPIKEVL